MIDVTVIDASKTCHCGHGPETHEHWRRGSDCGQCGRMICRSFTCFGSATGQQMRRPLPGLDVRHRS